MRIGIWVLLAGSFGTLAGCSEFVRSDEQTTAIDVVGEPADTTPESMQQPDILGSVIPMSDDAKSITDLDSPPVISNQIPGDSDESYDKSDDSDAPNRGPAPKPARLKTVSERPRIQNE